MKKYGIILIGIVLSLTSCKKDDETDVDFGYDYFPTQEGLYKIYDVMEAVHDDPSNIHDTTRYQLKTLIGERIIDNEGDSVNKFYRFTRDFPTDEWTLKDVWTIKVDDLRRGELVEENQRVIKLVFPTNNGVSWNINAHNPMDPLEATIEKSNQSHLIGAYDFSRTATVRYKNEINLVNQYDQYQVYASGIGLIHVHWQDYDKVFATSTPRLGDEYHWDLIEYGVE